MSQFFFNQRASLVNDVIEGTIIASPWNNLARLSSPWTRKLKPLLWSPEQRRLLRHIKAEMPPRQK